MIIAVPNNSLIFRRGTNRAEKDSSNFFLWHCCPLSSLFLTLPQEGALVSTFPSQWSLDGRGAACDSRTVRGKPWPESSVGGCGWGATVFAGGSGKSTRGLVLLSGAA